MNVDEKFIPIEKQSKKAQRKYYAERRGLNGFNTGTRTMKTPKTPTRVMRKAQDLKEINNAN